MVAAILSLLFIIIIVVVVVVVSDELPFECRTARQFLQLPNTLLSQHSHVPAVHTKSAK
jgi:hypothetical protein